MSVENDLWVRVMIEWDDKYKFNSFNSWKALQYRQWYDAIVAGKFLPPVEVSVDPVNDCQLDCLWCNGRDVRNRKVRMTREHLFELCTFFADWKVKAVCFAGGGEPTMHEALGEAFLRLYSLGMPVAIITNGLFLNSEQLKDVATYSRWVGISVDCAKPDTYKYIKGHDRFKDVMRNISQLLEHDPRDVTYKFLVHPANQYEIYDAIGIASQLGCRSIHIRPVAFRNFQKHEEQFDIIRINRQILEGFQDYGDKIKIFAVKHKFDKDMHVRFPFKKCLATPIMPIFQADGTVTLCIDRKADKSLILCRHDNPETILKAWGSQYHKEVIDRINIEECPKCTLTHVNEQIERAVVNDEMDWCIV